MEAWPDGPVEVRSDAFRLAPGESVPLAERAWPQLIYVESYTGPPLRLMLAGGGGDDAVGRR